MGKSLVDRWDHHAVACGIADDAIDRYWDILQEKYSESQRFYHTLTHIQDMFNHFDAVMDDLQMPDLVAMAIFFHDAIYQPTEKDNEKKSAELFKEFSQTSTTLKNTEDGSRVFDWILATKEHKTEVHMTKHLYGFSDLYFFLDMDMAILGSPRNEYKEYAGKIRKEYSHYSDEDFSRGRAKVLREFLKVPNIYATQYFRELLENKARENIQSEIEELEKNAG